MIHTSLKTPRYLFLRDRLLHLHTKLFFFKGHWLPALSNKTLSERTEKREVSGWRLGRVEFYYKLERFPPFRFTVILVRTNFWRPEIRTLYTTSTFHVSSFNNCQIYRSTMVHHRVIPSVEPILNRTVNHSEKTTVNLDISLRIKGRSRRTNL